MTTQRTPFKKVDKGEQLILTAYRLNPHHKKAVKTLARKFTKSRKERTSESQIVREAIEAYEYSNS